MLVTLRNSGAEGIKHSKILKPELMLDLLMKIEDNSYLSSNLLNSTDLDSFIIDKNIPPSLLILGVDETRLSWGSFKKYEIILEIGENKYRLYYNQNTKPDFFKKLFRFFYPEQAEKQVEELI